LPSAEATTHVPTSIEVASNSLIIVLTVFLRCVIRTAESVKGYDGARGKSSQLFAVRKVKQTTLAALGGRLERLEYLAGLRQESDRYEHWGLMRVYGEAPVQGVLREAHVDVMDAVLRTPMAQVYGEAEQQEAIFERPPEELLPPGADTLRAAHFSLVWDAMASVARRRASRRRAS
jgi:hypothetical protein